MKTQISIGFAPKTVALADGTFLHFWYANNKGMGSSNCTIIRSTSATRESMSRNQINILYQVKTSSWNGNVNFSKRVQDSLGI